MLHHLTFGRNIPRKGGNDYVTDVDWEMYCNEVLDSHTLMATWSQTQTDVGSLHMS